MSGLRPTRQRMALGWILFAKGDRHVTAEMLYEEASRAKVPVSLATVYNTLHQFTEVGLLRQVAVDGSKAYFDTNNSEHHHFFIEDQNDLMDIPSSDVVVGKAPVAPEGYEIARIDVVVRSAAQALRRRCPAADLESLLSPRTFNVMQRSVMPLRRSLIFCVRSSDRAIQIGGETHRWRPHAMHLQQAADGRLRAGDIDRRA